MSDSINPDHYKRLPVEAIEIIESAIQGAPRVEAAYLHGQVLKYVLRCWAKNGYEDLQKAKWYLDRLIDSQTQPVIKQSLTTEFKFGDRVRVCKPGSVLDGRVGVITIVVDHARIEVFATDAWGLFDPSELQPLEVAE